ncbi:MAG: DEAD/DEAH box helicase [Gammaproteobacteria bacterium]|nr:DEAD/DEAH box helicase [Gammaproteobacteria bacterium]
MTIFAELGLNATLQANVKRLGYKKPTYIQEKAIGSVLSGADTYAIAPTGTGKTAAYLLPTLQELSQVDHSNDQVRPIRAVFLVPTRELAQQVEDSIKLYGKDLGLRTITVFGGVRMQAHLNRFKRGADIIVATPKRLVDLLKVNAFSFANIQHFVMDEADRLVSMGIHQELRTIIEALPAKKQIILFSATDSKALAKFSETHQVNTKTVKTEDLQPALNKIVHTMYRCHREEKTKSLFKLIEMLNCDRALIFTRTKQDVDRITEQLTNQGYSCQGIHNEIPQKKRQEFLSGFKNKEFKFLVATDIVARGIDINDLYYVINYDLPVNSNDYIHRVGRTARTKVVKLEKKKTMADKASKQALSQEVTAQRPGYQAPETAVNNILGHSFSFVSPEQESLLPRIIKSVGKDIKLERMHW